MFREKERRMVKTCPCSSKTGAELADLPSPFSLHRAGLIVISQSFRFICVRKRLLKCCPQRTRLFGFSWHPGVAYFRSFELPFGEVEERDIVLDGMNEEEKDISVSPLRSQSI